MTNEEFCKAYIGERVLYKWKDIGAYVAGYLDKKYIILWFDNFDGCISAFTPRVCMYVCKNIQLIQIRKVEIYGSYKTSVIWKKKKNVAVTAFWWDAKTS